MHIAPGFAEGYQRIASDSKTFKNEVCERLMLNSHGPDLFESAKKVHCPVLYHICEQDVNIAKGSHKKLKWYKGIMFILLLIQSVILIFIMETVLNKVLQIR